MAYLMKSVSILTVALVAFALAAFLVVNPAGAKEKSKQLKSESAADPLAITIEEMGTWARDFEMLFRVNADPVLRAIVCRVPFTNWSLDALAMGTGIPKNRFFDGMRLLDEMGLVTHTYKNGIIMIRPATEFARVRMRKFAREWCTNEDACSVKR